MKRLDEEIRNADLARFDALLVPALREGAPLFESDACRTRGKIARLPWHGTFQRRRSPFDQAIQRISETGLRAWGQMDVLVGGNVTAKEPSLSRARPRWTVRNAQGRPYPIGDDTEHAFLCPSNPETVRLFCEVAVELADRYPISALVLDFRALPHETPERLTSNCLCFSCQEQVERDLHLDLQEVLDEGTPEIWREWQAWRNQTWLRFVRRLRAQIWSIRPGMPLFIRATLDRPLSPREADETPPSRYGPSWLDWARSGLIEGVLLDPPPGARTDAERLFLSSLPDEDFDALILPMLYDEPSFGHPQHWAKAIARGLPGWGLTQHLAEAWSSAIFLKPGVRDEQTNTQPALENHPLTACLQALLTAEEKLGKTPLGIDARFIREKLESPVLRHDLETLEGLIFQIATLAVMLDQDREADPDGKEAMARGWIEMARRLLRWHASLHCNELFLFDAG